MDADTREALKQRILLARAEDQTAGLFCESAFVGMCELLGRELAESVRASTWPMRQWVSFFRYPVADLLRMVDAAADLGSNQGGLSYAQALQRIGERMTRYVQESPLSRAYRLAAGNNPHDRLALSIKSSQLVSTYGERKYERVSPTRVHLLFRYELLGPSWIMGSYMATARSISSVRMTVSLEEFQEPGLDFQLLCSW